jgi:hypothetical protein
MKTVLGFGLHDIEYTYKYWDILNAGGETERSPSRMWEAKYDWHIGYGETQIEALEQLIRSLVNYITLQKIFPGS